jgi:hypothetical protein
VRVLRGKAIFNRDTDGLLSFNMVEHDLKAGKPIPGDHPSGMNIE